VPGPCREAGLPTMENFRLGDCWSFIRLGSIVTCCTYWFLLIAYRGGWDALRLGPPPLPEGWKMLSAIIMLWSSRLVGISETPIESYGLCTEPEMSVCIKVLFDPATVG